MERSLKNLFPEASVEIQRTQIVGRTDSLEGFRKLVWKSKILDAARKVLLRSLRAGRSVFELNKQAALAGRLSFSVGDAPLGDLRVEVDGSDLEATFKAIAPPTLRGRPVTEEAYERHLEYQRKRAQSVPATVDAEE